MLVLFRKRWLGCEPNLLQQPQAATLDQSTMNHFPGAHVLKSQILHVELQTSTCSKTIIGLGLWLEPGVHSIEVCQPHEALVQWRQVAQVRGFFVLLYQ